MDQCHIDPVYKTIWLNAKAGTEFFTGSTDGMVNLNEIILSNLTVQKGVQSYLKCLRICSVIFLLAKNSACVFNNQI